MINIVKNYNIANLVNLLITSNNLKKMPIFTLNLNNFDQKKTSYAISLII